MDSKKTTIYDCSILHLPKIHNRSGNITSIENHKGIPFDIKRVYYLYDVPGGEARGGHAHTIVLQRVLHCQSNLVFSLLTPSSKKLQNKWGRTKYSEE